MKSVKKTFPQGVGSFCNVSLYKKRAIVRRLSPRGMKWRHCLHTHISNAPGPVGRGDDLTRCRCDVKGVQVPEITTVVQRPLPVAVTIHAAHFLAAELGLLEDCGSHAKWILLTSIAGSQPGWPNRSLLGLGIRATLCGGTEFVSLPKFRTYYNRSRFVRHTNSNIGCCLERIL